MIIRTRHSSYQFQLKHKSETSIILQSNSQVANRRHNWYTRMNRYECLPRQANQFLHNWTKAIRHLLIESVPEKTRNADKVVCLKSFTLMIQRLHCYYMCTVHDAVIKWKHFPRYWPFVRGIHWSPVNSLHKDQWRGAGWAGLWFETPSRSLWRHRIGRIYGWVVLTNWNSPLL